ncbi:MAG: hypothetical protein FVQ83_11235 [Chloroflexi bacterium]|nr:hypothetical protein [Chloroflexota bacterium]
MFNRKLVLIIVVLSITASACGNGSSPATQSLDVISTSVAATMAAETTSGATGLDVVYSQDGNIRLWSEDGSVVNLYDSNPPALDVRFSPDGKVIAFTTSETEGSELLSGIWAINTDGSNLRQLVDGATLEALYTDDYALGIDLVRWEFIPGTHTLAFNTWLVYEGPNPGLRDDLYLVDTDTGAFTTLLNVGEGGEFYYSPDGSQIAIVTSTNLSLMDADGGNRRDGILPNDGDYQYEVIPRWSADGMHLRLAIPSPDPNAEDASITVWEIPLDGSPAILLKTILSDSFLSHLVSFISPDMSQIAYNVRVGDPSDNIWALHIAEIEGTGDTVYQTGDVRFIAWGPDSSNFVFLESNLISAGRLGVESEPLENTASYGLMIWVDANRFLYQALYTGAEGTGYSELRLKTIGGESISIVSGYDGVDFIN